MFTGRGVQPQDIAALTPDAHEIFEPVELVEHFLECRDGARLVGRPRRQPQLGSHRELRSLDQSGGMLDCLTRRCRLAGGEGKQGEAGKSRMWNSELRMWKRGREFLLLNS